MPRFRVPPVADLRDARAFVRPFFLGSAAGDSVAEGEALFSSSTAAASSLAVVSVSTSGPAASGAGSLQRTEAEVEDLLELVHQFRSSHNAIDLAALEQELGGLEALRELLTDGGLDHTWAGEADQGLRFGQQHVAHGRPRRRDASGRRVGQHADEQSPGGVESLQRGTGLRHLHQRERALVHAGPPRSADQHEGQGSLGGQLRGSGHFLTDHHSHRATEKTKLQCSEHQFPAPQPTRSEDHGLLAAGLLRSLDQLVGVAALVDELQSVDRLHVGVEFAEGIAVEQRPHPLFNRQGKVVVALRADLAVLVQVLPEEHLAAGRALDP